MPATVAGKTSGTRNLRPRPTSPEDTMYIDAGRESLNQYKNLQSCCLLKKILALSRIFRKRYLILKLSTSSPKSINPTILVTALFLLIIPLLSMSRHLSISIYNLLSNPYLLTLEIPPLHFGSLCSCFFS